MSDQSVVVAFIHTYSRDGQLGSYLQGLVDAFIEVGVQLHLIVTNDLVENLGAKNLSSNVSEDKLIAYIQSVSPGFIFTTNRGGITRRIMNEVSCPILTWMVDRIPFLHHGGGHDSLFCSKDHVVTSSSKNVMRLETIYPVLKGRVHFLPFATRVEDFDHYKDEDQDIEISFVGTYFYCGQLTAILDAYKHDPALVRPILSLIDRIEEDYDLDIDLHVKDLNLTYVLKDFDLDIYKFKGLLANAISLNKRVRALDAISDLGLKLYGTENWINVNQYSHSLLNCYQFGEFIKTREQLVRLYQRSKIGVNVSHHQAVDGLPYRVFDIMASRAILVTNYREKSDLYRLFGQDMPIPMYRDERELRKIVMHYKTNDMERRDVVALSNKLVKDGFTFNCRVREFFRITGQVLINGAEGKLISVPKNVYSVDKMSFKGSISFGDVHSYPGRLKRMIIEKTSPSQRLWIKRILRRVLLRS